MDKNYHEIDVKELKKEVYCGECGTKNEKGAKFCESCGAKLEEVKDEVKEKPSSKKKKSEKKAITKKQKILLIIGAVLVVCLFVGYTQLQKAVKPETIAQNYYEAYIKQNTNQMYTYCDLSEGGAFMTKEAFKNYYTSDNEAKKAKSIKNYKVSSIKYDEGNLTATVTISYTTGSSTNVSTDKIVLRKGKGKKYLFFDDWKVSLSDDDIVTDYVIKVPTGATITVDKIVLSEKYKEQENESSNYDIYTIPMMFRTNYNVTVKLANGFVIEDKITPSNYYSSTTITLTDKNISDNDKKTLEEQVKKDVKGLYDAAIADKKWDEISANYKASDLEDLEDIYDEIFDDVDGSFFSSKIQSFDITELKINSIKTTYNGQIEVWFKFSYKYNIVTSDGTTEEKTSTDTAYIYYENNSANLNIVDASSLPSYF